MVRYMRPTKALRLTVSTDLADWRGVETVHRLHMTDALRRHPTLRARRLHLPHAKYVWTAITV